MNSASSEPPKPKPSSTSVACSLKIMKITAAPMRPRLTVNMPVTEPARKAMKSASARLVRAACVQRTLPRTASVIPM